MIGGLSYRIVAHPRFVVIAPQRSTHARAPPRVAGPEVQICPGARQKASGCTR
jgi:hypothetical protein